jgi:hypothetical protein
MTDQKIEDDLLAVARFVVADAQYQARVLIDRMRVRFFCDGMADSSLMRFFTEGGKPLLLGFELAFLWGFFREFVREIDAPTHELDRVKILLIGWLTEAHGHDLQRASDEANATEAIVATRDRTFKAISALGRRAYDAPVDSAMTDGFRVIMESRSAVRAPDYEAYRRQAGR